MARWLLTTLTLTVVAANTFTANSVAAALPPLREFETVSELDQERQAVRYWAPDTALQRDTPLFVFLHSWSSDYRQDNSKWLQQAVNRGWIFLHPNFRGINKSPKACGSRYARQDILDAIAAISSRYRVDASRVYLAGVSGGGHMAMLMAGHHPDRFTAVSAWVGISDLAEWHAFHTKGGKPQRYAQMIEACLGGPPEALPDRDLDFRDRSPLFHIHRAAELPVQIYAGVEDGHSGSVPVSHSIRAFNQIARARNETVVSESEIQELWINKKLSRPAPSDLAGIPNFGRDILLHRTSGTASVTIFDGGHESLPTPACDQLAKHRHVVPLVTQKNAGTTDKNASNSR